MKKKQKRSKVLLMIDDARVCEAVKMELAKRDCDAHLVKASRVMQTVFDEVPHLVVIDEEFLGEGFNIAIGIKEDVVLKYIPVIYLCSNPAPRREDDPYDICLRKDKDCTELLFHIHQIIQKSYNELDLNPLTHLPGTRSSMMRLEKSLADGHPASVCCIDLSDLAAFNSAYGDARGDQILIRLGNIVMDALRTDGAEGDFVGHLGGDDFLVLTRPETAVLVSECIIRRFDREIREFYDEKDLRQGYLLQRNSEGTLTQYPIMSVSVAIIAAHGNPRAPLEIGRVASKLKKYMKTLPASAYLLYEAELGADMRNADSLEVRFPTRMESVKVSGLDDAPDKLSVFFHSILREKKIKTAYQPIIELRTKKIVGYEALTRSMAEGYFGEPAQLFSTARDVGRVKELDKLCVDSALRKGQALAAEKKLFLNINHETLIDPKMMKDLLSEKGSIGFKNLVIEVTEQSILRSFERVREALAELRAQGVAVAIDDVGGGAVSLRDVAVLRPDYIKFDRSLIRQIDTNVTKQQIVLSMLLFANGIHALATAEGIETKEEYEAVLMCGVHLGQGYYFARPGNAFPELIL